LKNIKLDVFHGMNDRGASQLKEESIVLKFSPALRVDLELEPGRVEEKTGKEKPGVTRLT
jgi:hypothetical protein